MSEPQAYAVRMFDLHKGELWTKAIGHAGDNGMTLCGIRVRFNRDSKISVWRRADFRDGVTCNRCRKKLNLQPVDADARFYY
jgi:hypothetical protein